MRKRRIPFAKVQRLFNSAIKRRDYKCMIRDFEPCFGQLECSHFFSVGSSPALRFYPYNAWTQCSNHHARHHNVTTETYRTWLLENYPDKVEFMERHKSSYLKYTDWLKAEIIRLCREDKLEELARLIEKELAGS